MRLCPDKPMCSIVAKQGYAFWRKLKSGDCDNNAFVFSTERHFSNLIPASSSRSTIILTIEMWLEYTWHSVKFRFILNYEFSLILRSFGRFCRFLSSHGIYTQNSQQKSVPDLNGVTVAFLALKKNGFSEKKILPKKKIFFTFFQCNFSVRTLWCFQKNFKIFFWPRKSEKTGLKSCS